MDSSGHMPGLFSVVRYGQRLHAYMRASPLVSERWYPRGWRLGLRRTPDADSYR